MKKQVSRVIAVLLAACMVFALTACGGSGNSGSSAAADGERTEPLVFTMGSCSAETDILSVTTYRFAELLEEKSNGMMKIDYYPASSLGNETELLDQILTGSLDLGCLSVNVCSQIWPDLALFSMPFAFDDTDMFWAMMEDEEFRAATNNIFEANGDVKLLGPFFIGFRDNQNTKHPITCLADFKGLTYRVMAGEIYTDTYNALGCTTATINFDELYTALQQGVCDGEDCTIYTAYLQGFFDIEKYESRLNMIASNNPCIMSTEAWNRMTEEEQEIFMEAYNEAEFDCRPLNAEFIEEYHEKAEAEGVEILDREYFSDEVMQEFHDAVQPVWDKYSKSIDADYYDLFLKTREKLSN